MWHCMAHSGPQTVMVDRIGEETDIGQVNESIILNLLLYGDIEKSFHKTLFTSSAWW